MHNPMIVAERMPLAHVCERLRALSESRSPAPASGPVPVILNEWCLLREAAKRLERMAADLEAVQRVAKNTPEEYAHWAIVSDNGKIIEIASDGKRVMLLRLEEMRMNTERARSWTVRPMFAGGVSIVSEDHDAVSETN
ncbi:MAG TPA: hypothetical protein VF681_09620 [Abditibacteriaceae bacterium]|jgi:hypothetical protein